MCVYVCVCMCMHVYLCICMCNMCIYVSVCICMYLYVSVCICLYLYVSVCICMYLYVSACICIYLYVSVCIIYQRAWVKRTDDSANLKDLKVAWLPPWQPTTVIWAIQGIPSAWIKWNMMTPPFSSGFGNTLIQTVSSGTGNMMTPPIATQKIGRPSSNIVLI